MVGPSKEFREYKNENPIYKFYRDLLWDYKRELTILCKSRITPDQFISFVTFIMVARKYEENAPKLSLYKHIQQVFGLTEDTTPTIAEKEDYFSKLLKRRREARRATIDRVDVPDNPQFAQFDTGMQNRTEPRESYQLSRMQFLQLCDEDGGHFGIQKKTVLRQFISSHNKSGKAIAEFYAKLAELCKKRSETVNIDTRVAYAINLNRYENSIPVDICYRIARFCSDHLIQKISDDAQEAYLALLAGSISGTILSNKITSTERPVLLTKNLISAALYKSEAEMSNYVQLRYLGCVIIDQNKDKLSKISFNAEDFWDFIYYNYPVFHLYQDIQWDEKGTTVSMLRKIIDILTQDSLQK